MEATIVPAIENGIGAALAHAIHGEKDAGCCCDWLWVGRGRDSFISGALQILGLGTSGFR